MKNQKKSAAAPMPDAKLRSQIRLAAGALHTVFCQTFGSGKAADRTLSTFFRENKQCGSRDRQFISEIVFAVLRHWGVLRRTLSDERLTALENGSSGPGTRELERWMFGAAYLDKLDFPAVRTLERMCSLAWPTGGGDDPLRRANALLRSWDAPEAETLGALLPDWIARHLPADFPLEQYAMLLTKRPPMWLRMQCPREEQERLLKSLANAELTLELHDRIANAVAVRNARINLFTLEEFKNGEFEVQDLASQAIGLAAAPGKNERWFDPCAGAGGKTLQLADLMERKGTVVASDIRSYKLEDLRKRARRAAFPNIMTKEWDGKPLPGKHANFDGVLVDAPCSCSGVWRRNPDGCWTLKEPEVAEMAAMQLSILTNAASGVKSGGKLIYATCSIFPEENGDVVNAFLAANDAFAPESFPNPLTGEEERSGMLQIRPGDGDCDAMFVAVMRKK